MSIYRYEEAIVEKMREITGDNRIIITPSDNIINVIPRISKDEIKLPLIHMIRNSTKISNNRQFGQKMNGLINNCVPMFEEPYKCIDGKIKRMHTIPIAFSHTFEVWSKTRQENDELIRELIWFFSTMPQFKVKIPYGIDTEHVFSLQLSPDIIDNTNVVSHKDAGEIFLQALITICDDAYLWKSSEHNPTCIHIGFEAGQYVEDEYKLQDYNIKTIEET